MTAYYNEFDPFAAQWLRNLVASGHIAPGDVDERSIANVRPDDLRGYRQCHFFAGIGGWSLALRMAGFDDDRPVWTGSCPCQPFSAAGAGKAADDERHLWPKWFPLIAECRPAIVFGEQVEAAIGWGWLDAVFADLEAEGYACGATVLPACGVGAPHIRQRLWFVANAEGSRRGMGNAENFGAAVREIDASANASAACELADADGRDASTEGLQRGGEHGQRAQDGRVGILANTERDGGRANQPFGRAQERETDGRSLLVADANDARRGAGRAGETGGGRDAPRLEPSGLRADGLMGNTKNSGLQGTGGEQSAAQSGSCRGQSGLSDNPWSDLYWLPCTDGKARPTKSGIFPLAHGIPARVGKLRAAGNAIVPQAAAEFIIAAVESRSAA